MVHSYYTRERRGRPGVERFRTRFAFTVNHPVVLMSSRFPPAAVVSSHTTLRATNCSR